MKNEKRSQPFAGVVVNIWLFSVATCRSKNANCSGRLPEGRCFADKKPQNTLRTKAQSEIEKKHETVDAL